MPSDERELDEASLAAEGEDEADDEQAPPEQGPRHRVPPWLGIGVVFALLTGAVAFLLLGSGAGDPFVYSKMVNEVMRDPTAFADRELRVEGELKQGSIQFREDPCEWRFVLEKEGYSMPVTFSQCVVPDTFRDGMGISVVVQGRVQTDGSFTANQLIPRCPSKYDMDQHQKSKNPVPHGDFAASRT